MQKKANVTIDWERDRRKVKYQVHFYHLAATTLNDAVGFINFNVDPSILRSIRDNESDQ